MVFTVLTNIVLCPFSHILVTNNTSFYVLVQDVRLCIWSGAVESTIKRIGVRIKISGAQWKAENVGRVLKQRCAYLNRFSV